MKKQKVFCIGLGKTGTRSLEEALKILGYSIAPITDDKFIEDIKNNKYDRIYDFLNKYDFAMNYPVSIMWRELIDHYSGAKFILTVRNIDEWIESTVRHFYSDENEARKLLFGKGSPLGNEELYLETYKRHNGNVIQYLNEKDSDFIVIDVCEKGFDKYKWKELCNFLGEEIPNAPFPHLNKNKINKKLKISL